MNAHNAATTFFSAVFEYKPEDHHVLIWTLADKRSRWFQTLDDELVRTILKNPENVYIGCGTASRSYPENRRCPRNEIAGVPGLWADIDFKSDVHKKSRLPDEAAARDFVSALERPSLLIHSGHGFQAWWLFKEFWTFDSDEERAQAQDLSNAWQRYLATRAARLGFEIDSVGDLSRILRIPGTVNAKSDPRPVTIIESCKTRYTPGDFEPYLEYLSQPNSSAQRLQQTGGSLHLNSNAQPPFDKFEALKSNIPLAGASWERRRKDLKDTSPSGYDMSLACFAAQCGWADQEICDLLIAARRKHSDDLQLNRLDYYQTTITRARTFMARSEAEERLSILNLKDDKNDSDKSQALSAASAMLGVDVIEMLKFNCDPPEYKLVTPKGAVHIGQADNLLSQTRMRAAILGATGVVTLVLPRLKWGQVVQALSDACKLQKIDDEATDSGAAQSWVRLYIETHKVVALTDENLDDIAKTAMPYEDDEAVYIFSSDFKKWINLALVDRAGFKTIGFKMQAAGFERSKINVKVGKVSRRTSRSVWIVPRLFLEEA